MTLVVALCGAMLALVFTLSNTMMTPAVAIMVAMRSVAVMTVFATCRPGANGTDTVFGQDSLSVQRNPSILDGKLRLNRFWVFLLLLGFLLALAVSRASAVVAFVVALGNSTVMTLVVALMVTIAVGSVTAMTVLAASRFGADGADTILWQDRLRIAGIPAFVFVRAVAMLRSARLMSAVTSVAPLRVSAVMAVVAARRFWRADVDATDTVVRDHCLGVLETIVLVLV